MTKAEMHRRWYQKNKDRIRDVKRENMRKYRASKPEHYRQHSRNSNQRLKDKVFEEYGIVCARCGFDDRRALTIDHILNNGAEERKLIGVRGVYRRALDVKNKSEYQVLCMNCQFIKRHEPGGDFHRFPQVVKLAWEMLNAV